MILTKTKTRHEARDWPSVTDAHAPFQELDAVSSEGLAVLVQSKSRLSKLDGALRIANVHGAALEVFQLVNFDRLFELHPNIETAVQQFSLDRKGTPDSDVV